MKPRLILKVLHTGGVAWIYVLILVGLLISISAQAQLSSETLHITSSSISYMQEHRSLVWNGGSFYALAADANFSNSDLGRYAHISTSGASGDGGNLDYHNPGAKTYPAGVGPILPGGRRDRNVLTSYCVYVSGSSLIAQARSASGGFEVPTRTLDTASGSDQIYSSSIPQASVAGHSARVSR